MALTVGPYASKLPQSANIQGFWRMEEESGTRADLSDNSNTLADNNTVLYGAGKIGNAADFELGNSEYLSITDALQTGLDITGEITICCWIKPETTQLSAIFGKYTTTQQSYLLYMGADYTIQFWISPAAGGAGGVNAKSTDAVSVDTWYHVAATLNQATDLMQIYINGLANGSAFSYSSNIYNGTAGFCIGSRADPTWYFDGLIDEAIIWNKCLTAAEVLQVKNITSYLYAGGFSGFSPWIFMKDMWEEHASIWRPNKKILIPQGI